MNEAGVVQIIGTKADVDLDETVPQVLEALQKGPLARDDVLKIVERKTTVVLNALTKLGDLGKVQRLGSGKKGDHTFTEFRISVLRTRKEQLERNLKPCLSLRHNQLIPF
jgi:predicted transcriptional regulator